MNERDLLNELDGAKDSIDIEEALESLNETKCLYRNENSKKFKSLGSFSIHIDASRNRDFEKDPYIKIYDNADYKKATASARISMKTGKILNPHQDGFGDLKLTKRMLDDIDSIMKEKSTNKEYDESVYDAFYDALNDTFKGDHKNIKSLIFLILVRRINNGISKR